MSYRPLDIGQVLQQLRGDVKYDPNAFLDNALLEALVAAVNTQAQVNHADVAGDAGVAGEYNFSGTCSGDYSVIEEAFFTPAVGGVYDVRIFSEETSAGATGGTLNIQIKQGATVLYANSHGTFGAYPYGIGDGGLSTTALYAVDGPITFTRAVTGFTGSPSNYRIHAVARLMA